MGSLKDFSGSDLGGDRDRRGAGEGGGRGRCSPGEDVIMGQAPTVGAGPDAGARGGWWAAAIRWEVALVPAINKVCLCGVDAIGARGSADPVWKV